MAMLRLVPLLVLAGACQTPPRASEVRVHGALATVVRQGDLRGVVAVANAVRGPATVGLGAAAELDGEITIVDGKTWWTRVVEGALRTDEPVGLSAALLVTSEVDRWQEVVLREAVPFAGLDAAVAAAAGSLGLDLERPFAFRVDGPVRGLHWHVVDGARLPPGPSSHEAHQAASVRGEIASGDAVLVGFHSRHHHGMFTHHSTDTHVHVVLAPQGITAHVDGVDLPAGTVLWLPAAR